MEDGNVLLRVVALVRVSVFNIIGEIHSSAIAGR